MNLIALFLGLGIERLVTNLLHLREPRWFDAYFDWGLKHLYKQRLMSSAAVAVVMILVLVLPVLAVSLLFADRLFGVLYMAFAVFVLLFSLGPRDLVEEVDEERARLKVAWMPCETRTNELETVSSLLRKYSGESREENQDSRQVHQEDGQKGHGRGRIERPRCTGHRGIAGEG